MKILLTNVARRDIVLVDGLLDRSTYPLSVPLVTQGLLSIDFRLTSKRRVRCGMSIAVSSVKTDFNDGVDTMTGSSSQKLPNQAEALVH